MKYIKTYENYETPEIGDYALVNYKYPFLQWENYIKSHAGKIIDHSAYTWQKIYKGYQILFELTDDILRTFDKEELKIVFINDNKKCIIMNIPTYDILMTSPDKEECEAHLASNKFNI